MSEVVQQIVIYVKQAKKTKQYCILQVLKFLVSRSFSESNY
jgi:hypothetical protein